MPCVLEVSAITIIADAISGDHMTTRSCSRLLQLCIACTASVWAASASAYPTKLDYIWPGNGYGTTVFIHGYANCTGTGSGSGTDFDNRCGSDPRGYWLNSTSDGGDGHDLMGEATSKCTTSGCTMYCDPTAGCSTLDYTGTWSWAEAFTVRFNLVDQSYQSATNDVAACLIDLANGTNSTGCNPNLYQRTSFKVVGHSAGALILDRIFSTGSWSRLTGSGGAIVGNPVSLQGALAGSKASSALYGVDGASNFCTTLVSWLTGWDLKTNGNASLTRGTVIGEANNGRQGKSPHWYYKVTTTGGGGSANNNATKGISEHVNDGLLGTLVGCIGYSTDDDTDGVVWMYDSDPTSNPSGSNGGKYRSQWTGYYWHWVASWANHSHGRNDAYVKTEGFQNNTKCVYDAPGTCIGQYSN